MRDYSHIKDRVEREIEEIMMEKNWTPKHAEALEELIATLKCLEEIEEGGGGQGKEQEKKKKKKKKMMEEMMDFNYYEDDDDDEEEEEEKMKKRRQRQHYSSRRNNYENNNYERNNYERNNYDDYERNNYERNNYARGGRGGNRGGGGRSNYENNSYEFDNYENNNYERRMRASGGQRQNYPPMMYHYLPWPHDDKDYMEDWEYGYGPPMNMMPPFRGGRWKDQYNQYQYQGNQYGQGQQPAGIG